MATTTDYDAVIIGAGHNGLAAAVHLTSKGWKVCVVEAAEASDSDEGDNCAPAVEQQGRARRASAGTGDFVTSLMDISVSTAESGRNGQEVVLSPPGSPPLKLQRVFNL